MSFLGKVFGGKREEKGTAGTLGAIVSLRETEAMLIKKQQHLERRIDQEMNIARENRTKNKRAAIQALKRKNRYAKQLQQVDGSLTTVETEREALENASTNTTVLESMKTAAGALKRAHQHVDVDQIHNMIGDIEEQGDVAKEISDAISNPVAFGLDDADEDDLEKELELLEQEALEGELAKAGPSSIDLPVPVDVTSKKSRAPQKERNAEMSAC